MRLSLIIPGVSVAMILLFSLAVLPQVTRAQEQASPSAEAELRVHAYRLAQESIVVDGHVDIPYRLFNNPDEDITRATAGGDFDYPRAIRGGLNAPFMSIYVPSEFQPENEGGARDLADRLIDMVESFEEEAPDKFAVARSPADIRHQFEQDLISLPMGLENGAAIEGDLENLQYFYDRGIRYITLTHSKPNDISDSSYDEERPHDGLSPFGEKVVAEMNRLGIMVDVSHISDEAFFDVMEITQAPAIASHSSARAFTPGWERNMNDDMIHRLAENSGVIMISFGSSFLSNEYQEQGREIRSRINEDIERMGLDASIAADARRAYERQERQLNRLGMLEEVADHIDHVVDLVGVDHVGIGSDFDGVFALPNNLTDASHIPNLVAELLRRGYSDADIKKILGQNLLRVWEETENVARQSN